MAQHPLATMRNMPLREVFGIVTFNTPGGKKRSLRADLFFQAVEQGLGRSNVYYTRKNGNSEVFAVQHTVEEVNQLVLEALNAG